MVLLYQMGLHVQQANKTASLMPINIVFALTFFLTRIVMYGAVVLLVLTKDEYAFIEPSLWQFGPVSLVAGMDNRH